MNETLQIIGNWNIFVALGTLLSVIWLGAYLLSWCIQWAWAWVDETSPSSYNWVVNFMTPNIEDGWNRVKIDYSIYFIKYKGGNEVLRTRESSVVRDDGSDSHNLDLTVGDISDCYYITYLLLIWFSILCLNFWYISMYFALLFAVAFTARMGRRGAKLINKHINDKGAHS